MDVTSPALSGIRNDLPPSSRRQTMHSRLPLVHQVDTSNPHNPSMTPGSAPSVSSVTASPYMLSLASSPEGSVGQDYSSHLPSPAHLELPESLMAINSTNTPTTSPVGSSQPKGSGSAPNKTSGLMRKISQTARASVHSTGQRLRRKASSTNQNRREHSTGPITRRRSDSKTASTDASTVELNALDCDAASYADPPTINGSTDTASLLSEPFSPVYVQPEGTAPTLPDQLIRGSPLIRVTKRKKKELIFFLSLDGSAVSWSRDRKSKLFFVDDIRSIRSGEEVSYRQDHRAEDHEQDHCLSVFYADPDRSKTTKALHLIAPSKDDVSLWINTLEALSKHREDLMTGMTGSNEREDVIRLHWDREIRKRKSKAVPDGADEVLDLKAVEALCRGLHIHCSKQLIKENFRLADSSRSGSLNYAEFKDFVRRLKERRDLLPIFRNVCQANGSASGLTKEQFLSFLERTQGLDPSTNKSIMNMEFERWTTRSRSGHSARSETSAPGEVLMDFEAFASYLVSESCYIYSAKVPKANFDRPLNEYFISSSHNTYLRGRQFAGESTTEAYITALRHGCRCVEVDCWNGSDGRPIVTHGHTRTTSVLFADCINVINRYAFEASEYPLLISLEVHCDAEQQVKMVQIMKEGFGQKLLARPLTPGSMELPSPEKLKHKILIKVKASHDSTTPLVQPHQNDASRQRSTSSPTPNARPCLPEFPDFSSLPPLSSPPSISLPDYSSSSITTPALESRPATSASSADEEVHVPLVQKSPSKPIRKTKQTSRIIKSLAELGVYAQGHKFRGFVTKEGREFNHIFSLDETKAGNLCRNPEDKAQLEDHNIRFLFRVYPRGMRFDSSNFDPNTFWRRGVQMVALNWQTYDSYMQMNQAMFAAGADRYGYVLKPDYLRTPRPTYTDIAYRAKLPRRQVRFSIEVISAQQLPRLHSMDREGSINPFIEVQMFSAEDKARGIATGKGGEDSSSSARNGYSGIGSPYGRRTRVVLDNGYNPQFNDRFELSLETKYPELIFVRWIVWHSPNGRSTGANNCTQLAVFTAKLGSLQQGYRHLPLYNGNGEEFIFSTLFCKIKRESPVLIPSSVEDVNGRPAGRSIFSTMLTRTLSSERGDDSKRKVVIEQKRQVMREIETRKPATRANAANGIGP